MTFEQAMARSAEKKAQRQATPRPKARSSSGAGTFAASVTCSWLQSHTHIHRQKEDTIQLTRSKHGLFGRSPPGARAVVSAKTSRPKAPAFPTPKLATAAKAAAGAAVQAPRAPVPSMSSRLDEAARGDNQGKDRAPPLRRHGSSVHELRRGSVAARYRRAEGGKLYAVNKTTERMSAQQVVDRLERVFEENEDPIVKMEAKPFNGAQWRVVRMDDDRKVAAPLNDWSSLAKVRGTPSKGSARSQQAEGVSLSNLALKMNGRSVEFNPETDAIEVAPAKDQGVPFSGVSTAAEAYKKWALAKRKAVEAEKWKPSDAPFFGQTTSGDSYKRWEVEPAKAVVQDEIPLPNLPFTGHSEAQDSYTPHKLEKREAVEAEAWKPSDAPFYGQTTAGDAVSAERLPVALPLSYL